MARDDYFVIVYKILEYLYKCLKEGGAPDIYNILTAEAYGIGESYFDYIMNELSEEGYIKGITKYNVLGRSTPCVRITADVMIKPKGIEFLQENSAVERAKKFLKEIKETVPGL